MLALKARVRAGRLLLDEPTNLPEGAEVQLALVDGDDLDDAARAALHHELEESLAEADAGETEAFDQLLQRLRPRP